MNRAGAFTNRVWLLLELLNRHRDPIEIKREPLRLAPKRFIARCRSVSVAISEADRDALLDLGIAVEIG